MASLKKTALDFFGEKRFGELNKWYDKALAEGNDYVVFVVRRSYILALIMERITRKKMEDSSSATFLTDGAVLMHCGKMAKVFADTGHFPRILICDDILIHGRSINHLLDAIEFKIISLLPECDPVTIRTELAKAVRINVFMAAEGISLLHGRYARDLDLIPTAKPKVWRKLSNDISMLILQSGIANAGYVYSLHITKKEAGKIIKRDQFLCTEYQGTEMYSKVWCINRDNYVKVLITVRLVGAGSGYRMIPFVFLPDLDASVTESIMQLFIEKMQLDDFETLMRAFHSYKGMRSYNEFLTFLLSSVVLRSVCKKYGIAADSDDVREEIRKLARNYTFNKLRQAENCLNAVLKRDLFGFDELMEKLEQIIPDDAAVLLDNFAAWEDRSGSGYNDRVCEFLESYFYERSWEEEGEAYILKSQPYYPEINYSKRAVTGVFDVLRDTMASADENILESYMAYILQMMDAGILAVSSYAPNETEVSGFVQFAKAGEQSAAIYPRRFGVYIPLLAYMQEECEKWHIDLGAELDLFCGAHKELFTAEKVQELKEFIQKLAMAGQKVADWDWNRGSAEAVALKEEYMKYVSTI